MTSTPGVTRPALLADTVLLVSGGSQGVGAGIVRAAVREGAQVAFTGRRPDVGKALETELPGTHFIEADVAQTDSALDSVAETISHFGRVDALVNSAGLTSRGTLLDTTEELFDQHIAVNLRGPFFTMQAAVKDMRERAVAAGGACHNHPALWAAIAAIEYGVGFHRSGADIVLVEFGDRFTRSIGLCLVIEILRELRGSQRLVRNDDAMIVGRKTAIGEQEAVSAFLA
mgnify:CR=1 FL=1